MTTRLDGVGIDGWIVCGGAHGGHKCGPQLTSVFGFDFAKENKYIEILQTTTSIYFVPFWNFFRKTHNKFNDRFCASTVGT